MKSFGTLLAATALLVLAGTPSAIRAEGSAKQQLVTSVFKVEGMTCGGCEAGVRLQVKKLAGVDRVEVSYKEGSARVTYVPGRVKPAQIVAAIERIGYKAKLDAGGAAN